jgi:hypothetical protein
MKCIDHLIVHLYDFLNAENSLITQVLDMKEQVILKSINLVDLICDFTIAIEKKRGFSYEDIQKRILLNK